MCDVGSAIPVTTIVRTRDMSNAWSNSATILFESVLISGNPIAARSEGIPLSARGGFDGRHVTVCGRFHHLRDLFLSGTAHVPGRLEADTNKQACGTKCRSSVVQALASTGQVFSALENWATRRLHQSHMESCDERTHATKSDKRAREAHREAGRR